MRDILFLVDWKSCRPFTASRVQIPRSPPLDKRRNDAVYRWSVTVRQTATNDLSLPDLIVYTITHRQSDLCRRHGGVFLCRDDTENTYIQKRPNSINWT